MADYECPNCHGLNGEHSGMDECPPEPSNIKMTGVNYLSTEDERYWTIDELIEELTLAKEHFEEEELAKGVEVHVVIVPTDTLSKYGAIKSLSLPCLTFSDEKPSILLGAKSLGY